MDVIDPTKPIIEIISLQDPVTGKWVPATPAPYYYRPLTWFWKRITGYRDAYGRKAQVDWRFWERDI